ncbi:MAG: hypothetical protein LBO04_05915 [Spirochaetaceae bacterium]|jgi:hypothetical protein|nr:hypothetical protein [Spirochaetaceae bacterium]
MENSLWKKNNGMRLKNGYQPRYATIGDSYRPVPEKETQDTEKLFARL